MRVWTQQPICPCQRRPLWTQQPICPWRMPPVRAVARRRAPLLVVDPLDAGRSFPSRRGAAQPQAFNLIPIVEAYPEEQQLYAVPMALGQLNVGESFVSVFGMLAQITRKDLVPETELQRARLMYQIQHNPYAFQERVVQRCVTKDNGAVVYRRNVQPNAFRGMIRLRLGDVMELWRWPETCASRQTNYALQHAVHNAVLSYDNRNRSFLFLPI